ncbi:MAG: hypothetical protein M3033_07050 [Acidobacteriota bacterium]|nr:hypothetical protein [Acidobacteriota bacterium]
MLKKVVIAILLIGFLSLEVLGQTFPREYWKELADHSKVIIVGTVEDEHRVGRPEKLKLSPDNPNPSERDIYVGMVFRVKVTETLKGKIKTEKIGENKYANIFLYGAYAILGLSDPKLFKGNEYVLFLEPNNDKKLEGIGTIEFNKQNYGIITKPFDYKSSYLVVDGFRGAVEIKTDKNKLIKEIKKSF